MMMNENMTKNKETILLVSDHDDEISSTLYNLRVSLRQRGFFVVVWQEAYNLDTFMNNVKPDYVHIASEGRVGNAFRKFCLKKKIPFTTSYFGMTPKTHKFIKGFYLKRFHNSSVRTLVPTFGLQKELLTKGFDHLTVWNTRGVDHSSFHASVLLVHLEHMRNKYQIPLDKPSVVYRGRITKEKNLEDFLEIETENIVKIVVGDGPLLETYKKRYPSVIFTGNLSNVETNQIFNLCKCFCTPTLTDVFNIHIFEAMAAGLPIASYNTNSVEMVNQGLTGWKSSNLVRSIIYCLEMDEFNREYCISQASLYTWEKSTEEFLKYLVRI